MTSLISIDSMEIPPPLSHHPLSRPNRAKQAPKSRIARVFDWCSLGNGLHCCSQVVHIYQPIVRSWGWGAPSPHPPPQTLAEHRFWSPPTPHPTNFGNALIFKGLRKSVGCAPPQHPKPLFHSPAPPQLLPATLGPFQAKTKAAGMCVPRLISFENHG